MIKSVTVINHLGESLKMELQRPDTSGFYIQSIEGLGPARANINIAENSILDGSSYNSARVSYRNIVMNLGFMFASDAEEIRHKSYKYFPLKKRITIQIETDSRICETYGYVESNEPNIFSNKESTQISIICPYPYFYDVGEKINNVVKFAGIEPMFSFPFSNESLDEPMIIFGEEPYKEEQFVNNLGDVDVGMYIHIHAIGNVSNIRIYSLISDEKIDINTSRLKTITGENHEIIDGDDIIISTIRGEKSATLIRNSVRYNIINCLDRYSGWFQLTPGLNIFIYEADEGHRNLQFRIEYRTVYGGV